ncbi:hypothetical protein ACNF42_05470 [Cuniculiplasma sp. SKW3]|uniref:hypothetical protein n=1 Tax=unclassified Cuniculiplasma TaxID=2619706 RepID=UPI003FD36245
MRGSKKNVVAAILISLLFFTSMIGYEIITTPSSAPVPYGVMPRSITTSSLEGKNNITYETHVIIQSGNDYSVTFDLSSNAPNFIYTPEGSTCLGIILSYTNETFSSPYTNLSFYVIKASITVGKFKLTSYNSCVPEGKINKYLYLNFPVPQNITQVDPPDHFYNESYCVCVTPVFFFELFHFNGKRIKMKEKDLPDWIYIMECDTF